MRQKSWVLLLGFAGVFAGALDVGAQTARVFRSGATYHAETCAGPSTPGMAHCHAHVVTDEKGSPSAHAFTRSAAPGGYGPTSLRAAYGVSPATPSPACYAYGPTVAVVASYGYPGAENDLAVYRRTYNLPACTTANGCFRKYNQTGVQGSYPAANTGWAQEQALDIQMVSAICPCCKIALVEANSAALSDLGAAVNTAARLGPVAISNSYGGPEAGTSSLNSTYYNHPKIAITASSGDNGYGVEFPASSPNVIAVGGTTLSANSGAARGWTETAWARAGSGCSAEYAKPAWQFDKGCRGRTVADAAAVADPKTGVAIYGPNGGSSSWLIFGGTSVAAPIVAGLYGAKGSWSTSTSCASPTTAGCALYKNANVNDVTGGANGSCGGSYLCTAAPGYDGPTGLGTPKGLGSF